MGYNPTAFAQTLRDAGFCQDRSVYQPDGVFMHRKFGRVMVSVSIYHGHFTVAKCWNTASNGYKVEEYAQSNDINAFYAKLEEWSITL